MKVPRKLMDKLDAAVVGSFRRRMSTTALKGVVLAALSREETSVLVAEYGSLTVAIKRSVNRRIYRPVSSRSGLSEKRPGRQGGRTKAPRGSIRDLDELVLDQIKASPRRVDEVAKSLSSPEHAALVAAYGGPKWAATRLLRRLKSRGLVEFDGKWQVVR